MTTFGATSVSLLVLQLQPSFEELQHTAAETQQLLMAGHRLEALRQADIALYTYASCEVNVFAPFCKIPVREGTECTERLSPSGTNDHDGSLVLQTTVITLLAVCMTALLDSFDLL